MPECIAEARRHRLRLAEEVWHIARAGGDDRWRGIACSEDEGIVLPGNGVEREPTCHECIALTEQEKPDV